MKYFLFTLIFFILPFAAFSQDPDVASMIAETSLDRLMTTNRELSGEDSATIDGEKVLISHRVSNWGNNLAAAYIEEQLSQYNLNVEQHNYRSSGRNIIATQPGVLNPEKIFIICAHYDAVTNYCADDNASGTSAVMEAARILSQYSFDNTIVYALWDEEEIGLIGAGYYASEAANRGDNILGVLNMDMISYDGDNDSEFDIDSNTDPNSLALKDDVISIVNDYNIPLTVNVIVPGTPLSDHKKFWDNGYAAILVGEAWSNNDQNPEYHTPDDRVNIINQSYYHNIAKISVGFMATKAVKNSFSAVINPIVCDSYTSPSGITMTETGSYADTIPNSDNSADSIIAINLTVNYTTYSTLNEFSCGDYTSPSGQVWTETGTYSDVIPNTNNCDSIMTINLTVVENTSDEFDVTECKEYVSPSGKVWVFSGTYTDIIPNEHGCDSVMTFNVTLLNTTSSIADTVCESYTSPSGQVWTESGTYTDIIPNQVACDSIITIDLTIKHNTSSSVDTTVCESYISPGGQQWTSTGIYNETISNSLGCDSLMTFNLTVLNPTSSTIDTTSCESFTSPGGQILNSSGIYNEVIPNNAGCDSLITINLTINNSTSSNIEASDCDQFTSPSGLVWTETGTYNDVIPNVNGCDSLITVNLTIKTVDVSISQDGHILTANNPNATFQWINCQDNSAIEGATNQSYAAEKVGSYAVQVTENECTETSSCIFMTTVGLIKNEFDFNIKLFPNPTEGLLNLKLEKSFDALKVHVSNLKGQLIQEHNFNNSNQIKINLSDLAKGIYVVRISGEGKSAVFRIMKE